MSLTTDVLDVLDALGTTEDEVAAKLAELGIKGVPRQECACPIYNYLSGEGLPVANVDVDTVFVGGDLVDLPIAISEFIACFDDGAFPDLISAPEGAACGRCNTTRATGVCCSSHGKELCHRCYRTTHFVQVCVEGCRDCAAEGLPLLLDRAVIVP